jgi:hypothetical protein
MILNYTIKKEVKSIFKLKDLVLFLRTLVTLKTFTKYRPASVEVSSIKQISACIYLTINCRGLWRGKEMSTQRNKSVEGRQDHPKEVLRIARKRQIVVRNSNIKEHGPSKHP